MAQEKMLTGCSAAAQAAKLAEVEVICSYPIRPYTAIMMELAKMVANGELDAEFVHGEGEHAQLSVVLGASAAGARAYTGSAGVGVTYAMEVYSPMAGSRYPVQMAIADRTLDPPGDFGSEHTDAMSTRDQGWLLGWACSPQEVFDNTLIGYRVGEDPQIMLPQMVCQDGYFISHIPDKVIVADPGQVKEFLPPYKAPHPLSTECPVSHGPQIKPDQGAPMDALRGIVFLDVPKVIEKATADFNAIFGRNYDPFLEKYKLEDAEIAFFIQGAHANTCRKTVDALRNSGVKAGMCRLRWVRPWPTHQIAEALGHVKVVGSVETSTSYGGAMRGGNLVHELRASLYDLDQRPLVTSFMAGLGGETIYSEDFQDMAKVLLEIAKNKRVDRYVRWTGMGY
ncbi:MAG: pyruvate ferredoxin oxidoreductase [Deltaproteobacteria bacterium]|nr:pyruvate ferredoxin oxidoreductase [Deltaproteobacteria bacterium]